MNCFSHFQNKHVPLDFTTELTPSRAPPLPPPQRAPDAAATEVDKVCIQYLMVSLQRAVDSELSGCVCVGGV